MTQGKMTKATGEKRVVNRKPPPVAEPVKKTTKKAAPVFKKPGQKYPTPVKTDALYKFYTSLLKQRPDSEMALKWCLEHGTMTDKKAGEAALAIEMKKLAIKTESAVVPPKRVVKRK